MLAMNKSAAVQWRAKVYIFETLWCGRLWEGVIGFVVCLRNMICRLGLPEITIEPNGSVVEFCFKQYLIIIMRM